MAIITINEIIDLVLMVAAIGFIFKDSVPRAYPKNYEPLEELQKNRIISAEFWQAVIAAAPAIVLHEAMHKAAALAFGMQATFHAAYTWLGIGVAMKLLHAPLVFFIPGFVSYSGAASPSIQGMIAFAGPLANLLLFAFATVALKRKILPKHAAALQITKQINLFLLVFNLIPIEPFDGAQVLKSIMAIF